eukprot:TRINITY_DN4992_c0_g1_i3.p3 TRINITY_DN4992_c0_g1~~TRINITY_DN4992_c0_g1_i3.p3  ORF type:complete len:225 (-),score=25.15 TRINITY_DN4992_c0_g1_i3:202-795(-)
MFYSQAITQQYRYFPSFNRNKTPPKRQFFRVLKKAEVQASQASLSAYGLLEQLTCDLSAFPNCQFFSIQAVIRPWREESVIDSLVKLGVRGLTVSPVKGIGSQLGGIERYRGTELGMYTLVDKVKLEVVCSREQVNEVVRGISTSAYTGEHGDGKIFVCPVAEIVRIRTGETGRQAEKMAGGMEDLTKGVLEITPEE